MMPLITVLLPTLNAEKYLAEALESLAAQTLQDFRVLVLDAGSEDRTRQVACSFPRVEFVECGRIGLGAQLRAGVEMVTGPLVARMDADDISLPGRFEAQARAMRPGITIVGTQISLIVGARQVAGQRLPATHVQIRRALFDGFPAFCHPSVMFRADLARRCGAYAIRGLGEDLDFFLRMTECGQGRNLPDVLHKYRLHPTSAVFQSFDEVRKNYSFGIACAKARALSLPEPVAEAFAERWRKRPWMARLTTRAECLGVQLYRSSRIRMANGRRFSGLAGAAFSVALRPKLMQTRARIAVETLLGRTPA
jgi:glycosyltransferase involved in cell wall biosynthesis